MNRARMASFVLGLFVALSVPGSAQTAQKEYRFADTNGVRLAYRVVGQGEPLLFLHGFNGTDATWDPIVAEFSPNYTLILPQLRGHGRSTNPSGEFTHREVAKDIFGLLDQLRIKQFKAVGFSSGGMTLLHMATQQPERVQAMVLISATSYFPEQARVVMRSLSPDSLSADQLERIGQRHGGGIAQARALMGQFSGFKDSYDDMNFTPPYLSTIQARTFVVHGDRDQFFPVSIPVEMYRSIPNSYLWIVPNGGHVPIYGENEETFIEKALEFLNGDWEKNNRPR